MTSVRFEPFVAVILILAGTFIGVPIALLLGIVALLLEIVRLVWSRGGLRRLEYRRRLERNRTSWGETIPLTVEVWNRKRLPLAWLRADDAASAGVDVVERELRDGVDGSPVLRNVWTLAPFERVVRRFHVGATRRGVFELGPVRLSAGDLLGRDAALDERAAVDSFLVRPRTIHMTPIARRDQWGGLDRAAHGLNEDPSRFAGVREYAPGDPLRRIHHRTSARLGRPMVKRFEPSRDRQFLIALDVQMHDGPSWELGFVENDVESLFVVAASLARSLAADRASVGLAAAGYTGAETRFAYLPPSADPGQAERVLDLLARLSSHPSAPFDTLLSRIARVTAPGTTVLVLTGRDPRTYVRHLRALERLGCAVVVAACGPDAAGHTATARAAGLAARVVRLDGPWRTATDIAVTA
ncbi:MAG: DUF58 domain-containing protein [Chloroflexota bacterium]